MQAKVYNATGFGFVGEKSDKEILFVDELKEADVSIVGDPRKNIPDLEEAMAIPHIAYSHGDAAIWYGDKVFENSNCIGCIKSHRLIDWEVNTVFGRHHLYHIRDLCSDAAVKKGSKPGGRVYPWLEYIHYPRIDGAIKIGKEVIKGDHLEKQIDISFRGTVKYKDTKKSAGMLATKHRAPIAKMFNCKGRTLGSDAYYKELAASRVTIAPWGLGAACWRDWEAMLCGCAVVKPSCPWVITPSGMYNRHKERIIWCKPDWSDLDEAIEKASNVSTEDLIDNAKWALNERKKRNDIILGSVKSAIKDSGLL